MKLRERAMPEETYWETLLDVNLVLDLLGVDNTPRNVVELMPWHYGLRLQRTA
jgi:hypothetical protein